MGVPRNSPVQLSVLVGEMTVTSVAIPSIENAKHVFIILRLVAIMDRTPMKFRLDAMNKELVDRF